MSVTNKTDSTSKNIEGIISESVDSCEKALKSGIKLREDTMKLSKEVLQKVGSPEVFQTRMEAITIEAFPAARKQMQEAVKTLNEAGNRALSLCEKTVSVYQAPTLPEAQRRVNELTESCFAAVRDNVKNAMETNTRIVGFWTELMGRLAPVTK